MGPITSRYPGAPSLVAQKDEMRAFLLSLLLGVLCIGSFASAVQAQVRTEDEQAIQRVLADFVTAWNQHDMKLWSELFTDDADCVVVTAKHLKTRSEIFKYHDELHKGPFKDHQMKAGWQDMRFLRDDVALGHVKFEPGNDKMKRTALATVMLLKQNGKWLITAFHNTLLYGPPLPEQFPPNSK
jgi:uncharacterized protein (TIGR02246 family)